MEEKIDKWAMLVIGLVGGWVISTAPGWMHASSYKDWWDIATAVGTVGATGTALFFGLAGARRRRMEQKDRASLCAPSVADKIRVCIAQLKPAAVRVLLSDQQAVSTSFSSLKNTVDDFKSDISNDDLLPLIALDNRVAHKIAHALAQVDGANRLMDALVVLAMKQRIFPLVRSEDAHECAGYILDAVRLLEDALEICVSASKAEDRIPARREYSFS